jgi:probable F420-dependent oxidoreductase
VATSASAPEGGAIEFAIRIGDGVREAAAQAAAAEAAGFESCWVTETDHDALLLASVAAAATSRIVVGTAIALAFTRSPTLTAMASWDLDDLSDGRFMLGLGTQVKGINELRFSVPYSHPVAKLAEYAQTMRTVWAANRGEAATHEGRFYTVTLPTFTAEPRPGKRDVPILFAAVLPAMTTMAGRTADGVLTHPLASPEYVRDVTLPTVAAGLERAGRAPGACHVTACPIAIIDDDVERARREVKHQVAFWGTTRTYRPMLEQHERGHLVEPLREAFAARDFERMIELVDDELCDALAATGAPDEVWEKLARWEGVADRVILGGPRYGVSPERARDHQAALIESFAARKDCLRR